MQRIKKTSLTVVLKATGALLLAAACSANNLVAAESNSAHSRLSSIITGGAKKPAELEKHTEITVGNLLIGEGGGEMHFISQNGRYVFTGRMIDIWERKEIKSVNDVLATAGKVNMKSMGFTPDKLNAFVIGAGNKNEVYIFVDPLCEFCNKLILEAQEIAKSSKDYQFNFVVIPALGDESNRLARAFYCSSESLNSKVSALLANKIDALEQKSECDMTNYNMTLYAATSAEVSGVPFLINSNGQPSAGMPTNLLYWLEGKN